MNFAPQPLTVIYDVPATLRGGSLRLQLAGTTILVNADPVKRRATATGAGPVKVVLS